MTINAKPFAITGQPPSHVQAQTCSNTIRDSRQGSIGVVIPADGLYFFYVYPGGVGSMAWSARDSVGAQRRGGRRSGRNCSAAPSLRGIVRSLRAALKGAGITWPAFACDSCTRLAGS